MQVWSTALLVRIAFVDGGVNGANLSSSCLTRWTWCLWSTWASSNWIVIQITILIELNRFAWALSTLDLTKWRLCILSSTSRYACHSICILCIQSSSESRFNCLISRILLLWILLIDNILLELSLLLRILVCLLFQWNLLDIHLLLHSTLADDRCLIWV